MAESLHPPASVDRGKVVAAFTALAEQYPESDPADLPMEQLQTAEAYRMFDAWRQQEAQRAAADGIESTLRCSYLSTILFVEAGFHNPDYVECVANDWLIQDLEKADEAQAYSLALEIMIKIYELNKTLPTVKQLPATHIGAMFEDKLRVELAAELALMEPDETADYLSEWLSGEGVEDPEALMEARGYFEA